MSAKKTHISNREQWDWSLSNCELARHHGMSPQAVRKTRIKFGHPAFKKEKQPKVYSDGSHLPGITLKEVNESEGLGRARAFYGKWWNRFWANVKQSGPCWLWTGGTRTKAGYGMMMIGTIGKTRRWHLVHRLAYLLEHEVIPPGKLVRHKCDVKLCVNPNHLELGTDYDNVMDAVIRQGMNCGEKNGMSKTNRELRRYD
jgi:hypothetical protein